MTGLRTSLFTAATCLGTLVYIAFGRAMALFLPRLHQGAVVAVSVVLIAASFATIVTGLDEPMDLKHGDFGTPLVGVVVACAISMALILLAERVAPILPNFAITFLGVLAPALLVVLFTHAAFLVALLPGGSPRDQLPGGFRTVAAVVFLFPAALVTRVLLTRPGDLARVGSVLSNRV